MDQAAMGQRTPGRSARGLATRLVAGAAAAIAAMTCTPTAAVAQLPPSPTADSLGLAEATRWLIDSLPRVGSFTLHDVLAGQPMPATDRAVSDVRLEPCTISWLVTTASAGDTSRVRMTVAMVAIDPSLAAARPRDSVRTEHGWLVHSPALWEVTASTRDGSRPQELENLGTKTRLALPTVALFVVRRDDAWRTAAAIASLSRACQHPGAAAR